MKSADNFFLKHLQSDNMVAAPLAGISHMPFRLILRRFFKGLTYSEMMSVEGISRRNADSMEFLDRSDSESPLVFQLFGGKPQSFAESVIVAEGHTDVDAFDINMGCPVKKVLKAGGGCSLLSDLPRLKAIVKATRGATAKPFSIKIRVGLNEKSIIYKEVIAIAEGEGADAIVIHGRTKSDMFGGTVHYEMLADAAAVSNIPVIGNGGVVSLETYGLMKSTGVDGVMIGRGMMKAPWIFESLRSGFQPDDYLIPIKRLDILLEMYTHMMAHASGRENKKTHYLHVFRKFATWFSKGLEDATGFRTQIYQVEGHDETLTLVSDFFKTAEMISVIRDQKPA